MKRQLLVLVLSAFASPALAEDCPTFGFTGDYLSSVFCNQLSEITGPATRNIEPGLTTSAPDWLAPEWLELSIIREAHRVDPAKTLQLIQRIKDAGGQPLE